MKLQDLIAQKLVVKFSHIRNDKVLARQIQTILAWHDLLEKVDGRFGRISNFMLRRFQTLHGITENHLGMRTIKALIETHPQVTQKLRQSTQFDFWKNLLATMAKENYTIFRTPGKINIVYLKGMNLDFTLNCDTPNQFNDLAIVFDFVNGKPRLLGKWLATATPGRYYTDNSHPLGALHHNGQATAWTVGKHRGYEALVQSYKLNITRDANRDFLTDGDKAYAGWFGANCHGSRTNNIKDIARWSAGCKVVLGMKAHWEWMRFVKSDRDYLRNKNYVFTVTVIDGTELITRESKTEQSLDTELLAMTAVIFGEAKNKSTEIKQAIAFTVLNRYAISRATTHSDWWGNTIEEICFKPQQYNYRTEYYDMEKEEYSNCLALAREVVSGLLQDNTKGATHYSDRQQIPYWAKTATLTKKIGRHSFYK